VTPAGPVTVVVVVVVEVDDKLILESISSNQF
jgi:hypothetical protein